MRLLVFRKVNNFVCSTKATPSDTLVSGPEVFLIACGRAAFLIMSYQFHLMNLIILQMNIIITLFFATWDYSAHA